MSKLSPEVIEKFTALQEQVWQNVSTSVAHVSEEPIEFLFESPELVPPETARALAGQTALTIQFGFAALPDDNLLVVMPSPTFAALASFLKGDEISEPDESLIPETRDLLEGIVQGICLACGLFKNEPMVASGLSIRYQAVTLPNNFGRNDDLLKTEITVNGKDLNCSFSWFVDQRTAIYLVGQKSDASESAAEGQRSNEDQHLDEPGLSNEGEVGGLSLLMDVPLEISVELGRVKMLVKDVVDLGAGSVVEIDKAAGEPVDVMVNGRLVARGEVVVIEDNFGVRITEILNAQDRLSRLGEAA